jgi:hypothetical protein
MLGRGTYTTAVGTVAEGACPPVDTVRTNATIDWTVKESVRAKLRVMVNRRYFAIWNPFLISPR